jgi:hypothetical protein
MITSLNPAPGKKARVPPKIAIKILGQICEEMHTDPKSLASIAKHQVIIDNTVSVCGVKQLDFYVSLSILHIGVRGVKKTVLEIL